MKEQRQAALQLCRPRHYVSAMPSNAPHNSLPAAVDRLVRVLRKVHDLEMPLAVKLVVGQEASRSELQPLKECPGVEFCEVSKGHIGKMGRELWMRIHVFFAERCA